MRRRIHHSVVRQLDRPASRLVEQVRLTPSSHDGHLVQDWRIDADRDVRIRTGRDGYGNEIATLYVDGPVDALTVTVIGELLVEDKAGIVAGAIEPIPPGIFLQTTALTRPDDAVRTLAHEAAHGRDRLDCLHRIAIALNERVAPSATPVGTAAEALAQGAADPAALANLFAAVVRTVGVPARVVSGLRCDEADAWVPHLWAEALIEGFAWIGFDPHHRQCPDDRYVRLAVGLDARDAAPFAGAPEAVFAPGRGERAE